jgi:hypothetical protein
MGTVASVRTKAESSLGVTQRDASPSVIDLPNFHPARPSVAKFPQRLVLADVSITVPVARVESPSNLCPKPGNAP